MSKLRVKTSYNDRTNTYYHRDFHVTETDYAVGDFYEHEEIKAIEEIMPDIESMSVLDDYKLVKITTSYNGEYDPENEDFIEKYLAIKK